MDSNFQATSVQKESGLYFSPSYRKALRDTHAPGASRDGAKSDSRFSRSTQKVKIAQLCAHFICSSPTFEA